MSSSRPIIAIGLQYLPTELTQKIASDLDNSSLLAFVSTSRNLHSKAYFVFGHRFFGTLKFFLHPVSLQALTDIANTPVLASYVQTVAFGTELVGIIDPIHDEDVKREAFVHSKCSTPTLTLEQLATARCEVDSRIISQALRKLPNLALIMIGKNLDLQGHPIRRSWGMSTVSQFQFNCSSGHCLSTGPRDAIDVVFRTLSFAMQQARLRNNIKFCVGFGGQDRQYTQHNNLRSMIEDSSSELIERLNHLQLNLDFMDQAFITRYISSPARLHIETLEVAFPGNPVIWRYILDPLCFSESLGLHYLPLSRLQRLTIKQLRTKTSTLADFLRIHTNRLVHVSLIECFAEDTLLPLRTEDTWLHIVMELQRMPQLTSLCLDHLESSYCEGKYTRFGLKQPNLDLDKTLRASWKGKEEVEIGLHYLVATYRTFEIQTSSQYIPDYVGPHVSLPRYYLNLRYANFKASSHYGWTKEEAISIDKSRARLRSNLGTRLNHDIVDNEEIFPIPLHLLPVKRSFLLPPGHILLPAVFQGRWRTVWISNAPRTWKFGAW